LEVSVIVYGEGLGKMMMTRASIGAM
jgi:hypothetical protein